MWVAPMHRRRGVGRALVDAVIAWTQETGGSDVGLWVTRGNSAAEHCTNRWASLATGERQPLPSDPSKEETRMVRAIR